MANFVSDPCRIIPAHLTTTGVTSLYTAQGYAQAVGIRVANLTGGAVTLTINYYSALLNDTFRLLFQGQVPANGAVFFPLEAMALAPNDEIRVQAGTSNALDVILTIAEIPGRSA
jgi:hypothetical protein